jgi:hypothetical protein
MFIRFSHIFRKHALTLQLHTAHILSAHASLEAKNKALQDIKEQRNRCVWLQASYHAGVVYSSS